MRRHEHHAQAIYQERQWVSGLYETECPLRAKVTFMVGRLLHYHCAIPANGRCSLEPPDQASLRRVVGEAGLEPAKADASGFTVRPLCHSGHSPKRAVQGSEASESRLGTATNKKPAITVAACYEVSLSVAEGLHYKAPKSERVL